MITGFEAYTKELTPYEAGILLPAIVRGMTSKLGKHNAVTNRKAIDGMRRAGLDITGPRFRKILHIIRVSGIIEGIVGTSKGYYIACNDDEWRNYLKSINERLEHIQALRDALTNQFDNWKREHQ
jgi:hypothetical protein